MKTSGDPRLQSTLEDLLIRGHRISATGVSDPYLARYFQFLDQQTDPNSTPGADLPNIIVAPNQRSGGGAVLGWWNGENVALTYDGLDQGATGRLIVLNHELLHVHDTGAGWGTGGGTNGRDGNPIGVNSYGQDGTVVTAEQLAYGEMKCILGVCN